MLFYAIAAFFFWLIFREIRSTMPKDNTSIGYMSVCLLLALLALWQPLKYQLLEHKMNRVVRHFAGDRPSSFHCQTLGESIFDRTRMQWAGYTVFDTGAVTFKAGWCQRMRRYLADPAAATGRERYSLMLLVHEAMHVRGERDEQKTECQAIQRLYQAALLLDVPEPLARQHSLQYFQDAFPRHPYYSRRCKPHSDWDEGLSDSIWQFL